MSAPTLKSLPPETRVRIALQDHEQVIYNLAWDYCTRVGRGEAVSLENYLSRKQLSAQADADRFKLLVNMHTLLVAVEESRSP